LLSEQSPSYFAAWSPDGKSILFTGRREGHVVVLTMPAEGGPETIIPTERRIENPVWSPDSKYIYFDTIRFTSQIWRMHPDGSQPEQITTGSDFIDSEPHVSPDNRQMALLSGDHGNLLIRVITLATGDVRIIAIFPHSQGGLAATPWSADSKRIAYVSYQYAPF
jgi:Tol biopolymer transport system component